MNSQPSGTIVAGRYRIVATLGSGAQGIVYKAFDPVEDRVVALKIFNHPAIVDDARRRFLQGPWPRLDHPNIVRTFEHGSTEDRFYIAMQWVDGRSLADILQARKRLEPSQAIEIAIHAGVALTFAHRHSVIHRDVKPSNIMVSNEGHVLLADFGLMARSGGAMRTRDRTIVGTPAYMSPEQALGELLDPRSDIFSLGAVLYEALTGCRWWSSDGAPGSSAEILKRVVLERPRSVRILVPDLSESLDGVLQKALAKDPAARYQAVEDFVKALLPSPAVPLAPLARGDAEDSSAGGNASTGAEQAMRDSTLDIPPYLPQSEPRLRDFAALWDEITQAAEDDKERFIALIETLVRGLLREAIGYRLGEMILHFRGTVGWMVEAPFLWIRQSKFPLLFVNVRATSDVLATVLQQLAVARATEYFAVLVIVTPRSAATSRAAEEVRRVVADSIYCQDFVVLDRGHLASIIAHNNSMPLIESILEQVGISVLSPYVVRGPVPEQMFFGREGEIKVISQSIQRGDYAVVGGRRIGKSSTLLRLKRQLGDDQRYRPIYMDCEPRFDHEDFFTGVREYIDTPVGGDPLAFRKVAALLREASAPRTVVFLLDEIDELLAFDAAQRPPGQLFRTLRAASQEGLCRFVFSGSRTLFRHLRDPHSPFFNFCESIQLRRLDARSVAEIVRKPMRQLGIGIPDEDQLVQRLIDITSCHPNLAQWLCDRLVRSCVDRSISSVALEEAIGTLEFREYYMSTAWGDATAVERLISLTISESCCGLIDVMNALTPYSIRGERVVQEALEFLQLGCLLERDGTGRCRFGLEHFPAIARASGVVPGAIESLALEARRQCS